LRMLASSDVLGDDQACRASLERDVAREKLYIDQLARFRAMAPVAAWAVCLTTAQVALQRRHVLGRPDLLHRHRKEFRTRVAIARDGGFVHREESEGLE